MGFLTVLAAIGDPLLRTEVCQTLRAGGYEAAHCGDADDALRRTFVDGPDLLIVHGALPPHGGHALIRRVRLHSSVPLMMLDASADDEALVRALDLGADDYVPLPCAPSTLGARVRAVLRRLRPREDERRQVVVAGDVTVDLDQRRVFVQGREVALSPTEWQLLAEMATNPGRLLPHEDLLTRAWGPEYRHDRQYLRVWIRRLRRKLEDDCEDSRYIHTVPGLGYMFSPAESASTTPVD